MDIDTVEIENATIRLEGIEKMLIRMSFAEHIQGAEDNEIFMVLQDMIRSIRKDIEEAIGIDEENE